MKITVYTALIGPADELRPPPPSDATFLCVTDRADAPAGWTVKKVSVPAGDERKVARAVKHTPTKWCPQADVSIWMDASFDLLVTPEQLVDAALRGAAPVVGFRHPDRQRIRQEAAVITEYGLAPADRVAAQIAAYQADGFDTDEAPQTVITTTGLLVRQHSPAVTAFQKMWRQQLEQFTLRDQLSVDYVASKQGLLIGYLPGSYRENRFVQYQRARHRMRRDG